MTLQQAGAQNVEIGGRGLTAAMHEYSDPGIARKYPDERANSEDEIFIA
jgi:hypothetical protein